MTRQSSATARAEAPAEPLIDEQGFQSLYEGYNRPVYAFFVNRGCSRDESRDLVQETFLAAYRSRAGYRGDSPVESWLFGVAANVWRTWVRDGKRLKRDADVVSLDEVVARRGRPRPLVELPGPEKEGPLHRYLNDERTRLLHEALHELPEKMRYCVLLRLKGLKYREIETVLNVSLNTVRTQLFDAREKLRQRLAGHFPDLDL